MVQCCQKPQTLPSRSECQLRSEKYGVWDFTMSSELYSFSTSGSLKSNELWPGLRDHVRVNLLTPSGWLGASDTDSCSLKNLVLGETFEGFEARHIAVLERFTLAAAREMEGGVVYRPSWRQLLPNSQKRSWRREPVQRMHREADSIYSLYCKNILVTLVLGLACTPFPN